MSKNVRIFTVPPSIYTPFPIQRWREQALENSLDQMAEEVPVALIYNGVVAAVMLVLPQDLPDYALGYSINERIVSRAEDLQIQEIRYLPEGIEIQMQIPEEQAAMLQKRERAHSLQTAIRQYPPVSRPGVGTTSAAIQRALRALKENQPIHLITGFTHAAAWANAEGQLQFVMEDVGRHNALDKLIGRLTALKTNLSSGFVVMSSRASYEIVHKIASSGVTLVVAVSAPTALAIRVAEASGLTLVAFGRAESKSHVIYTEPQRVVDEE